MPKSSRSDGVAIITACVVPPKDSATGTSSGRARAPGMATPALTAIREALAVLDLVSVIGVSLPPEPAYSAGSSASSLAMRRDRAACASYSSCQTVGPLDGVTCTAVTLYSGQLVAQSV